MVWIILDFAPSAGFSDMVKATHGGGSTSDEGQEEEAIEVATSYENHGQILSNLLFIFHFLSSIAMSKQILKSTKFFPEAFQ